MYLTSKNLFVVVYCRIFAPLKRILLRGESPQTIFFTSKRKKNARVASHPVRLRTLGQFIISKKIPIQLRTL